MTDAQIPGSVFIENVTNGRKMVYRAYHRPLGVVTERRYPMQPDTTAFFDIIRGDLLAALADKVRDRQKVLR